MTVKPNKLSEEDRRKLNIFLKFFIQRAIPRHTQLGYEYSKGQFGNEIKLPKNLEVNEQSLMYEGLDLAHQFYREYENWKIFNKGKSVKFK